MNGAYGFTGIIVFCLPMIIDRFLIWFKETKNYNPNDPNDPINIEKSRRIHRGP